MRGGEIWGFPLRAERKTKQSHPFFLNSVDLLGREIDPRVYSVAQEMGKRALSRAEKLLGDPALALNLFEEVAGTVSRVVREKAGSGQPPIKDLRGYPFLAFMRRVLAVR